MAVSDLSLVNEPNSFAHVVEHLGTRGDLSREETLGLIESTSKHL
jgi:hypothetical protein